MLMDFFSLLILGLIIFWLVGFVQANDFSVPTKPIRGYKKILYVSPHPDDETLSAGGLLAKAAQHGAHVQAVILTQGEHGTPDAHLDDSLRSIRIAEAQAAAQQLGIMSPIQADFGDGQLTENRQGLTTYLKTLLITEKPDLIITYDTSGLYGHPDHIVVSEIITELATDIPKTTLWYVAMPQKILTQIGLPEHMAKDPAFKSRRQIPTHKVWIGWSIWARIRAIYAYTSQFASFEKGLPLRPIPLWVLYSFQLFEYYSVPTQSVKSV
jgi:LmbE family N-acetylglucosaminyl deacetylase